MDWRQSAAQGGCPSSCMDTACSLPTCSVPGVQDIAFVRSQMANARVRKVTKPSDATGRVFTLADLGPINVLEAGPELAAHRHSPYPPAGRWAGPVCRANHSGLRDADARASRGSGRQRQALNWRNCRPSSTPSPRCVPDSPRVFDEWPSNAYISTSVVEGNPETLASAPIRLRRRLRINRQATVSLEGRGALAYWDHRLERVGGLPFDPGRAGQAHGAFPDARDSRGTRARHRAGRRRRFRRQEPHHAGGRCRCGHRDEGQASGALDRGSAGASARIGSLPRPYLRSDHFG